MKGSCSLIFRDRIILWFLRVCDLLNADHMTPSRCSSWQESQIPEPLSRAKASVYLGGQHSLVSTTDKLVSSCHRWVNPLCVCPLPQRMQESYFPGASFVARPYCLTCFDSNLDLGYRRDLNKAPDTAFKIVD